MILPEVKGRRGLVQTQSVFGGLNATEAAGGSDIKAMAGLTSEAFPLLCPREVYSRTAKSSAARGMFSVGSLFLRAEGTNLYANGALISSALTGTDKVFAALGERVIIFPDKLIYDGTSLTPLGSAWTGAGLTFSDGSYAGKDAKANTITASGVSWASYFRPGDGVTITGCTIEPGNNLTLVIREIDGDELRFYEDSFIIASGTSYSESGTLKIERRVPDLDFLCTNENRVWGCKGDTICCSKLGDPTNWYVFDGVSTDSWSVESGTAGSFTGCVSYLGYPIFFKEDGIIKVFGNRPQNFATSKSADAGVKAGCARSLAIVNETLYYAARSGIAAYTGGLPQIISEPTGASFANAAGCVFGPRYYVSAAGGTYAYDTRRRLWHRENELTFTDMCFAGGCVYADAANWLYCMGAKPTGFAWEATLTSSAEFGDTDYGIFNKKRPVRLRLRAEVESGASLTVYIKYDSGETWETLAALAPRQKGSVVISCPIKRCDHYRIKISGSGAYKIYAMETEFRQGGKT